MDESPNNLNYNCKQRSWAKKGSRFILKLKPKIKNQSLFLGISEDQIEGVTIVEGGCKGETITKFLIQLAKKTIQKYGNKNFVIVMDNAPTH